MERLTDEQLCRFAGCKPPLCRSVGECGALKYLRQASDGQLAADKAAHLRVINEIFAAMDNSEATPNCNCGCWQEFKDKYGVK